LSLSASDMSRRGNWLNEHRKSRTEMTNVQMEISSESEVANEATCRNTGIHHVGLRAKNSVASAEF